MDSEEFKKLDPTIQMSFILAMNIRNNMENFHFEHLSDEQMNELNPIIRQAIYDILSYFNPTSNDANNCEKIVAQDHINYLIQSIPDYWELPNENIPAKPA